MALLALVCCSQAINAITQHDIDILRAKLKQASTAIAVQEVQEQVKDLLTKAAKAGDDAQVNDIVSIQSEANEAQRKYGSI